MAMKYQSPIGLLELARVLGLPAKWLKVEADSKRIPCLKVGKKRLFDADAVRRVLATRAAEGEVSNGQ